MTDGRMTRALGLPGIPVNGALLKEGAPWVAHTCHCSGLQPWDTTWGVQRASRSQISTISSVHPVHGIPEQEHVYSTAVKVCSMYWLQKGGWGWGDSQLSKSHVQHMTYLRKASKLNLTRKFTFLRLLHHKVCKLLWKHFRFLCHFSKTFCNSDMILI